MFTIESIVVQTWVRAIRNGVKSFEEVPALSNLRDCVAKVFEGDESNANV